MKKFVSKLLTLVMMASIVMNSIYTSANATEAITTKEKEKPHYQLPYDFNKERKAVDNSKKEEVSNEIVETEVVTNQQVASDVNTLGEGEKSTSYDATINTNTNNEKIVLGIPEELRTIETADSIVLIWNSVANGKEYELEVDGEIKSCGYKTLFVHSNVKDLNTHRYRVRAINGDVKSEWSSYVEKSKKLETIDSVENIVSSQTENSIKISWDKVSNVTGYDIEVDGVIKENGQSTNYISEALAPNTSHTYKVRAKKDDNYGQWSKVITVSTLIKKDTTDKEIVQEKIENVIAKEVKDSNTEVEATETIMEESSRYAAANIVSSDVAVVGDTTSPSVTQVVDTTAPEEVSLTLPLNIKVESTNNTLLVHWDKVEGAKSYDVEVDGNIIAGNIDTFYEHSNLLPGTQHTYRVRAKDDTRTGEWSELITGATLVDNMIVNSSITLSTDKVVNSLNLTAGSLNLNGFKLTVLGDVVQTGGSLSVGKGKLTVGNNYTITGNSNLIMNDIASYVLVGGNFEISSNMDGINNFKNGTLEIKGNLTQTSIGSNYANAKYNFRQDIGFTVKLSGEKEQTVTIGNYDLSKFNILDMNMSAGVIFINPLSAMKIIGWDKVKNTVLTLCSLNLTFDRDETLNCSLNQISGTINLNGFKLTVLGDLLQTSGTMNISTGKLIVGNNYTVTGNSYLRMLDTTSNVLVEGNFEISSTNNGTNYFSKGILEIKGNITQTSLGNNSTDVKSNFNQGVGFVVKLSGKQGQTVTIGNYDCSKFNILDIGESTRVIFASVIAVSKLRGLEKLGKEDTLTIGNSAIVLDEDLTAGGNIKLISGTINLNGFKLTVLGNLLQTSGTMNISTGKLIVGNNYTVTGNSSLWMLSTASNVLVEGNFEISSTNNGTNYFSKGILEIKGNVTQTSLGNNLTDVKSNFNQGVGFVVKLSGEQEQTVTIGNYDCSKFNILDIGESTRVIFASVIAVSKLRGLEKLGKEDTLTIGNSAIVLDEDLTAGGNIKLISGTINLNGFKLTVLGNLLQTSGTMNISTGKLIVGNNYTVTGNSSLWMLSTASNVLVEGNFEISSTNNGTNYFSKGVLEIKGNATQTSLGNNLTDAKSNFNQGVGFVVKLSGEQEQTVTITNFDYSQFNILDISKSNGVVFINNLITKHLIGWEKVRNTILTIYGSYLTFDRNEIINCDLELVGGSLNLNGYSLVTLKNLTQSNETIKINGGQLIVGQDYIINGNSSLIMTNSNDYVLVTGNFDTKSRSSESGYLSAGVLEIKGNLTQWGYNDYSLCQTELFTLKLTGNSIQTVKVVSGASSPFIILDISLSAGVIISSGIKAFMISGLDKIRNDYSVHLIDTNIRLYGDATLNCGLDLDGGSLDLNGHNFNMAGGLSQTNSKVTLNGGHLKIRDNYFIEGNSLLVMNNVYDIVVVGGSFITSSNYSESGYLTKGILILKGDFSQSGNSYSFDATGDHYVVFNGVTMQHVYFEDKGTSKFNDILIQNLVGIDYSKSGPLDNDTIKSLEKLSELAKILDAKAVTIVKAFIEKERYGDILEIALKWKNENPGSLMTEAEANAMIIEYEGGKSIDEILEAIKKARNAYLAAFGDQAPIIAIGNFAIDDIRMINGRPYGKMKQVLDCLFDVVGTDPSNLNYFQTTWNVGKSGVDFYTVHVINPNTGVYIVKIYNPTDAILNDADNGDPYCDILKIISDLGLSSKLEIGYFEQGSSYVIYVDVKQHYLEITASIAAFLEKHQVDIDAFCFATMELGEPINLALQSIKLNMQGIKPLVALESLARMSGKTLPEVMESIKVGMPLLERAAEAVSKLKNIFNNVNSKLDEFFASIKKITKFDNYYEVVTPDGMVVRIERSGVSNISKIDEIAENSVKAESAASRGAFQSIDELGEAIVDIDAIDDGLGNLDWDAIVSKKGETRIDHINRHAIAKPERASHGVFYNNPVDEVNKAWAKSGTVTPIDDTMGGYIYNIPVENVAYESGTTNTGKIMNYVTIVTKKNTGELFAAFPSFGDYGSQYLK